MLFFKREVMYKNEVLTKYYEMQQKNISSVTTDENYLCITFENSS